MALNAFGTKFQRGNGATPEVFTTIAAVHNISAPALSRDSIETTTHDSADGFRTFIPGLKDGGEVTIDINWLPADAGHGALYTELTEGTAAKNYRVLFPNDFYFQFSGIVTGFDSTAPIDDRLTASVTFTVTGAPTLDEED